MGATKMQGRLDLHELEYKLSDYPSRFLSPEQAIRFLVFRDGDDGKIKAKDGLTGRSYVGTDPKTVMQYAVDHLTAGRNYREKIMILGDYTIQTPINLSSYTILEVHGRLKLANGANQPIIAIPGGTVENPKVHIDILGGVWDGNKANQTAEHYLIDATGIVKNFRVNECHFINPYSHAVHLAPDGSSLIDVSRNRAESTLDIGGGLVFADMIYDMFVQENYCSRLGICVRPSRVRHGVFSRNIFQDIGGGAFTFIGGGGYDVVCEANVISGTLLEAIEVVGMSRMTIANNEAYNAGTEFLHSWGMCDSLVANNLAYNCGSNPPDGETKTAVIFLGLYGTPALRNLIITNKIYSDKDPLPQYGVYEFPTGDYNQIRSNWIEGYSIEKIHLEGVHSTEKYND